jgi:hypothetical protein
MINSVRKALFSNNPMGVVQPNSDGWTNERIERKDPENQKIKRNLIPITTRRWLQ